MTAKQLFSKTTPFIRAKLLLGLVTVGISAVLLLICMGLGWLFGDTGMVIMFAIWCGGTGFIRYVMLHYFGYLLKAGHVAVIAEACKHGQVPADQINYGKTLVTERFATSNIYFAVDQLVSGAVRQIQNTVGKVGNALDFIPGMEAVTGLAQFFVSISLGYVDECCLGWTFWNKNDGAFKSAADGVVIYAQNWKALLSGAAKTMLKVIIGIVAVVLAIFIPVGLIFKLLGWSPLIAFLLACLIAWVVKFAILDSYIMIQMMATYMEVAPKTVLTFDLYSKLCSLSDKFKELWNKGQAEQPKPAYTAAGAPVSTAPSSEAASAAEKPIFCGSCGAKNDAGTKFCGSCGAKLQ